MAGSTSTSMTADAWITALVLVVTFGVLVLDRFPALFVLAGAVATLLLSDVIEPSVALSGLSSTAPATIALLYIIAGAATATGALVGLVDQLLARRPSIAAIGGSAAALSGVVPNTPLVAMAAPRIVRWGQHSGHNASRLLLPLSFASILGGVVTVIGTSTNLVVSDLLVASGAEPIGVFEISPVGIPVALVGVALLSLLAPRLLRDRTPSGGEHGDDRQYTVAMRVTADGGLVGASVSDAGLRNLNGAFLAVIERSDGRGGTESVPAAPSTILRADDVCCFIGDAGRVVDLQAVPGLVGVEAHHVAEATRAGTRLFEAVIAPASTLAGSTLRSAEFRGRYGGAVLAIHRADGEVTGQIGREVLRPGDVLLVLADEAFAARWRGQSEFSLVAAHDEQPPARRSRAWLVYAALAVLLVTSATGLLTLFEATLVGAVMVVLGGAIGRREARRSIDVNVVLTIAVAVSLGAAVASSGLALELAGVVERLGALGLGDHGRVAVVMLVTIIATELLTNTAAAALMVPVATAAAAGAGMDPRAMAIAVLFGASCSFLTPVGYQTNLMVYGLGGYRFTDFTRVGLPLSIATLVVCSALIPLVF